MKKIFISCCLLFFTLSLSAQKEDKAIKTTINNFFEGLEKGDTALIRNTCTDQPVLQTFMANEKGELAVQTEDFQDFLNFVGTPSKNRYEEKIEFESIQTEKSLASVWTPYTFWVNGKISHCGTNSFQLVKTASGWKIQYIIDTRRRQGCSND